MEDQVQVVVQTQVEMVSQIQAQAVGLRRLEISLAEKLVTAELE
jgi:hypothetical protein